MEKDKMIFSLEFGKHSAPGIDKEVVEDAVGYFVPEEESKLAQRGQLFLVTDGAGLAHQGDIASQTVLKTIINEYFESAWLDDVEQMLHNSIQRANAVLYQQNVESEGKSSLSCSVICVVIHEDTLYAARVGDCHAFLISNERLVELLPSPGDATASALSQRIHERSFESESVNRLGLDPQIEVAHVKRRIQLKDIIFLCTHNVAASISEEELGLLLTSADPVEASETVTLDAVRKFPDLDATAVVLHVKGIRRLSFDESSLPETLVPPESSGPKFTRRKITIKGKSYTETPETGGRLMPMEEVDDFSRERDYGRRHLKRTQLEKKKPLPWGKIIGIPLFLAALFFAGYAAVKFAPEYWRKLTAPGQGVQTITADSLRELKQKQEQPAPSESLNIANLGQIPSDKTDSLALAAKQDTVKQQIAEPAPQVVFKIAVIDGSLKSGSANKLKTKISAAGAADDVSYFKSKYRIRHSKILWRKSSDELKLKYVTNRLLKYADGFEKAFGVKPEIFPLDFSLVLGADFKIPTIRDRYVELTDEKNDYYLEILNGSKVSGLARKMSNMLHHQKFDDKRLVVVDYRNADKLTYAKSFIKCESSKNDIALKMAASFGLPSLITNASLFDIKIIIGTDIQK